MNIIGLISLSFYVLFLTLLYLRAIRSYGRKFQISTYLQSLSLQFIK